LEVSDFLNFHLKAFTQRRRAANVAQRKAKEKNFAVTLRLCVFACALAFLVPACPGWAYDAKSGVVKFGICNQLLCL
jgi:hypothetical protein